MDFSSLDLTLEQQFELRKVQDSIKEADREQVVELLLSASQLLMLKDNVIKDLIRQVTG
ncbi:MAG: NblA/ycf18 family protein [Cyanobacteria bacterium]|nr:NblA/ycf18 family protein [Cyanobacteriota bacterium]MDW8202912.1 NblA/ycf18 family protein [Cyanobacteriota bacterium SKYGB_h_bin112]